MRSTESGKPSQRAKVSSPERQIGKNPSNDKVCVLGMIQKATVSHA
jgi:hypothetical protein